MMHYYNDEHLEDCPRCGSADVHQGNARSMAPSQMLIRCTCRECLEQWKVFVKLSWPEPDMRPNLEIVP